MPHVYDIYVSMYLFTFDRFYFVLLILAANLTFICISTEYYM